MGETRWGDKTQSSAEQSHWGRKEIKAKGTRIFSERCLIWTPKFLFFTIRLNGTGLKLRCGMIPSVSDVASCRRSGITLRLLRVISKHTVIAVWCRGKSRIRNIAATHLLACSRAADWSLSLLDHISLEQLDKFAWSHKHLELVDISASLSDTLYCFSGFLVLETMNIAFTRNAPNMFRAPSSVKRLEFYSVTRDAVTEQIEVDALFPNICANDQDHQEIRTPHLYPKP